MKNQDKYYKSKSGKNFKTHLDIEFPLQRPTMERLVWMRKVLLQLTWVITTQKKPSHNHFLHNIVADIIVNESYKTKKNWKYYFLICRVLSKVSNGYER